MVQEGFYRIVFGGAYGTGLGMLAVHAGKVIGADAGGGVYRGNYRESAEAGIELHLEVTIPPNMPLVTGEKAKAETWILPIDATLRSNFASGMPININTPAGMINVAFTFLGPM